MTDVTLSRLCLPNESVPYIFFDKGSKVLKDEIKKITAIPESKITLFHLVCIESKTTYGNKVINRKYTGK